MRLPISELVTGLFVVVAIGVGVFLVLANQRDFGTSTECVAYFDNVALLEKGAQVAVNGHAVGEVTTITNISRVLPGDEVPTLQVEVVFTVADETMEVLRQGSQAQIDQASFLGSKFLKIIPSTAGEELPRDFGGRAEFGTKAFFDMFGALAELKDKVDGLIQPAQKLLVDLDEKVVAFDMDKVNQLVSDADSAVIKASTLLDDADTLVKDTAQKVNGPGGLFDDLGKLLDDTDTLVNGLRADLDEIKARGFQTLDNVDEVLATSNTTVANLDRRLQEKTLTELEKTLADSQALMRSVDQKLQTLTSAGTQTLANADNLLTDRNLRLTMVEARDALRELKLLMLSLRANPAQVIFGGPGEVEAGGAIRPPDRKAEFLSGRGRRYDADK